MMTRRLISMLILCVLLASPAVAGAWNADFFEHDASGAPTYEEMVIQPQAVYDPRSDRTFIVYQGAGMHPYAMAYDHARSSWRGPFEIGENYLGANTHGAPSLVIDAEGHLVVFYGGHLGSLQHARSKRAGDVGGWVDLGAVRVGPDETTIAATYPQAALEADGSIRLYYRRDTTGPLRGDWESVVSTPAASGEFGWTEPEIVLDGSVFDSAEPTTTGVYWYANIDHDAARGPALAAIRRDLAESNTDFYVRKGVYYMERSAETTWTSVDGVPLDHPRGFASLEVTAVVRPEGDGYYTNQAVMRRDASGRPAILYLAGTHLDDVYEWRFALWDGVAWRDQIITTTDNFFDAGTFEFMPDGTIEAFLTTGGPPDGQWFDDPATELDEARAATRGGDISWWRSLDGTSWSKVRDVIVSPGPSARYNNPQIVERHRDGARLIFSEWNNDAANFVQKVYLWGDEGFKQRALTPEIKRLAGDTRIETAVRISRTGFPLGATTAVVASAETFPDVLCGVPLAHALKAPVLLTRPDTLDPALAEELKRLDVSRVIILGGHSAISSSVESAIGLLRNSRRRLIVTERIAGASRYETSVAIAARLAEIRGEPRGAVIASGQSFADALAVSPYAARRFMPILLTPPSEVSTVTAGVLEDFGPDELVVVGGSAAVSPGVAASYEASASASTVLRWGGADRYETAEIIANQSLAQGHSLERFALATGEDFADAVGGGLLMARMNGVVLTTRSGRLEPSVVRLLKERAFTPGTGVIRVYVLGGASAVQPQVVDELAAWLLELDAGSAR